MQSQKQKQKRKQKRKDYFKAKVEMQRVMKIKKETKDQKEAVKKANKIMEIRKLELMGLSLMFKLLKGRDVKDSDKFTPKIIADMCKEFITKHKKMNKKDQKEYQPLIPLAEAKIQSYDRYTKREKELAKEKKKNLA